MRILLTRQTGTDENEEYFMDSGSTLRIANDFTRIYRVMVPKSINTGICFCFKWYDAILASLTVYPFTKLINLIPLNITNVRLSNIKANNYGDNVRPTFNYCDENYLSKNVNGLTLANGNYNTK